MTARAIIVALTVALCAGPVMAEGTTLPGVAPAEDIADRLIPSRAQVVALGAQATA
jgi:hypothetical protein